MTTAKKMTVAGSLLALSLLVLPTQAAHAGSRDDGRSILSRLKSAIESRHSSRHGEARGRYHHRPQPAPTCDTRPGIHVDFNKGHYVTVNERRWVPASYETVTRRVCVQQAYHKKVWHQPVYETRRDRCGRPVRIMVRAGHWDRVLVPARYENRCERVYKPGYYKTVQVKKYVRKPGIYVHAKF